MGKQPTQQFAEVSVGKKIGYPVILRILGSLAPHLVGHRVVEIVPISHFWGFLYFRDEPPMSFSDPTWSSRDTSPSWQRTLQQTSFQDGFSKTVQRKKRRGKESHESPNKTCETSWNESRFTKHYTYLYLDENSTSRITQVLLFAVFKSIQLISWKCMPGSTARTTKAQRSCPSYCPSPAMRKTVARAENSQVTMTWLVLYCWLLGGSLYFLNAFCFFQNIMLKFFTLDFSCMMSRPTEWYHATMIQVTHGAKTVRLIIMIISQEGSS